MGKGGIACACSKLQCSMICLAVVGVFILIPGIVGPYLVMSEFRDEVHGRLIIDGPGHEHYTDWVNGGEVDDTPIYLSVTFYNVTNADEYEASSNTKINMVETGKYVWQIKEKKYNIAFSDGGNQVEYQFKEWYEFQPEMSSGSDQDYVTLPSLAWTAVVVGGLGGESNTRAVVGPQTLATTYTSLIGAVGDLFYTWWGSDVGPLSTTLCGTAQTGNIDCTLTNPTTGVFYGGSLSFNDFVNATWGKANFAGVDYSTFGAFPISSYNINSTQSEYLLYNAPGQLLNLITVGTSTAYGATFFLQSAETCFPCVLVAPPGSCDCDFFDFYYPKLWTTDDSQALNVDTQLQRLTQLYLVYWLNYNKETLGAVAMQQDVKNPSGGSMFQTRTVERWMLESNYIDPVWLIAGEGPKPFFCDDNTPDTTDDNCNLGTYKTYTGLDDHKKIKQYTEYRSMESCGVWDQTADGLCYPVLDCPDQNKGLWLADIPVSGYQSSHFQMGDVKDNFFWENGVNVGDTYQVWSGTVMRALDVNCRSEDTVYNLDTIKCYGDLDGTVQVNPVYLTFTKGLINRATLSAGLPAYATPHNYVGLDAAERAALGLGVDFDITTNTGCQLGVGTCVGNEEDDSIWFQVEPMTGAVVAAHERLTQVFMTAKPPDGDYSSTKPFNLFNWTASTGVEYPAAALPVFYVDKYASVSESDANDAAENLAYYTTLSVDMLYVMPAVGGVVLILSLAVLIWDCKCRAKRHGVLEE